MNFDISTKQSWKKHDRHVIHKIFDDIREQEKMDREDARISTIVSLTILALMTILFVISIFSGMAHAETGTASWYSYESCIKEGTSGVMANGKKMDNDALTAASWFYPLGTNVKVTHKGKTIVVKITDRGPSKRLVKKGRIIDLSKSAFQKLASLDRGVINVEVTK